jgi:hypothetical protein
LIFWQSVLCGIPRWGAACATLPVSSFQNPGNVLHNNGYMFQFGQEIEDTSLIPPAE